MPHDALGGGTDINGAVGRCQSILREPCNTIFGLISGLNEGGVQRIALLALRDEGRPDYDPGLAARLAAMGEPSFACTTGAFPGLMAAAIRCDDIGAWAAA